MGDAAMQSTVRVPLPAPPTLFKMDSQRHVPRVQSTHAHTKNLVGDRASLGSMHLHSALYT